MNDFSKEKASGFNDPEFLQQQLIEALAILKTPAKCPGCKRNLNSTEDVALVSMVLDGNVIVTHGLCHSCTPKREKLYRRIDNRVRQNPEAYLLPLLEMNGVRSGQRQIEASDPWVQDDKGWFEQTPHRTHRLRASYPDEPTVRGYPYVIVRQIAPGSRVRVGFALDPKTPKGTEAQHIASMQADDNLLMILFERGCVAGQENCEYMGGGNA